MKKYEYVNIHINKVFGSGTEDHRQIIDRYAEKGYRYVGYIPTNMNSYGKVTDVDLIFEMEV